MDRPNMDYKEFNPYMWNVGVEWYRSGHREVPWPYADTGADVATNQGFLWAWHNDKQEAA